MAKIESLVLPLKGLSSGLHQFDFQVDTLFFRQYNKDSDLKGEFEIHLTFDKRSSMLILEFDIQGYLNTSCDRCLEPVQIPVKKDFELVMKYGVGEDDLDIVFIDPDVDMLNLDKYIYEFVYLACPITHVLDNCDAMEDPPCNEAILSKLYNTDDVPEKTKNIWGALNDLKINN